jgi:hypothetical protein
MGDSNVFHDTRQLTVLGGSGDRCSTGSSRCVSSCLRAITLVWSVLDWQPNYIGCTSGSALRVVCRGDDDGERTEFIPADAGAAAYALLEPSATLADGRALVFDWRVVSYASASWDRPSLAAVLLFVPMTATLGGIRGFVDSIQIFALNMIRRAGEAVFVSPYLMALFILAPDIRVCSGSSC